MTSTGILPSIVVGETWDGFTLSASSDGTSLAENLDSVTMVFRDADGAVALTLTSADGDIDITNANAWSITVNSITPFPLVAGTYTARLTMTNATGRIKKWFRLQLSVTAE